MPLPPLGHWARVAAGKKPSTLPYRYLCQPTGAVKLGIVGDYGDELQKVVADGKHQRVEQLLNEFVVKLEAEAVHRKRHEEHLERQRLLWEEEARRRRDGEEKQRKEMERLKALEEDAHNWSEWKTFAPMSLRWKKGSPRRLQHRIGKQARSVDRLGAAKLIGLIQSSMLSARCSTRSKEPAIALARRRPRATRSALQAVFWNIARTTKYNRRLALGAISGKAASIIMSP